MLWLRNLQILVIRYTPRGCSRLFALLMQCDQHQSKLKADVILGAGANLLTPGDMQRILPAWCLWKPYLRRLA
jgi:hypothetical protein